MMRDSALKAVILYIEVFVVGPVTEKNSLQQRKGENKGVRYNCKYVCSGGQFAEAEGHCASHPCFQNISCQGDVRRRQVKTWDGPCIGDCGQCSWAGSGLLDGYSSTSGTRTNLQLTVLLTLVA